METIENPLSEPLNSKSEKSTESDIIISIIKLAITKWWLFFIIGIIAAIGGFVYASLQKPVYQSYLSFALDEGGSEGGGMSAAMGLAAQLGVSLGGAQDVFSGDNILQIIQSRRIIEDVLLSVDTFNNKQSTLIEYYLQNQKANHSEAKGLNEVHFYPGETVDSLNYDQKYVLYKTYLQFKSDYILARRPNKTLNIYELMITSPNERFSKIFTDKLIEKTILFYTDIRSKKARETLEILEKALPQVKGKLDATISNKALNQDANLNTAFANAQIPIIKEQINSQVYSTAYAEIYKNLEMARFQYLKSIPLMQIIDPANYPMKKIQQSKLITAVVFSVIVVFIFFIIFFVANFLKLRSR